MRSLINPLSEADSTQHEYFYLSAAQIEKPIKESVLIRE